MKIKIKEVLLIIILSGAFGLLYNFFTDKSLAIIPKDKPENVVEDSVLFGDNQEPSEEYLEKTVTYDQIVKLLDKPDVIFIDARSPEQYEKGHIGKSINIFPYMENEEELLTTINGLPHNKLFIVYCDGGACDLSHELSKIMFDFGYSQCFIYQGGWEEWIKKQNS